MCLLLSNCQAYCITVLYLVITRYPALIALHILHLCFPLLYVRSLALAGEPSVCHIVVVIAS